MAGAQIPNSVSIIDNLKGYLALSLTEYNTSAAAAIAAGSVVEIAGAFFTFASDETPTGWSSVVTATTGYIALTASGTAGSQVVNANYTSTAPAWRDDLQGWYASAASSVRIVGSVYKAESTSYYPKYVLKTRQSNSITSDVFLSVESSFSVSGTATISGNPICSAIVSSTAGTSILPLGSIIAVATSNESIIVNQSITNIYCTTASTIYWTSSYTAVGTLLSGSWVCRGLALIGSPTRTYLAQRIS